METTARRAEYNRLTTEEAIGGAMLQVRDVFQVKFGKIDQAVQLFARLPKTVPAFGTLDLHYHVLTDISGPMFTLVTELMLPDLAAWDAMRARMFGSAEFEGWFKDFKLLIEDGRREFYDLQGECEDWSRPGAVVVRQTFRALKWQISPTITLLQRYGALLEHSGVGHRPRILTDASGPFFQAVVEAEADNLADWESHRRSMFRMTEFQVWFLQLSNLVEAGKHEFFRVEGS